MASRRQQSVKEMRVMVQLLSCCLKDDNRPGKLQGVFLGVGPADLWARFQGVFLGVLLEKKDQRSHGAFGHQTSSPEPPLMRLSGDADDDSSPPNTDGLAASTTTDRSAARRWEPAR